ncbi:MAG: transposase family protein [Phycisphaerales bacterium]|nr:transposase family protein [Phycisphaerales bacterium]
MLMWRDLSISELHQLLSNSHTYDANRKSLGVLLQTTARSLAKNIRPLIRLPESLAEFQEKNVGMGSSRYDTSFLTLVIDGTSLPTYSPKATDLARAMHVSYKSHRAYRYFILTHLNGHIAFVSRLDLGSVTDTAQYDSSECRKMLTEHFSRFELPSQVCFALMGDKGYTSMVQPASWKKILTKSAATELQSPSSQTRDTAGTVYESGMYSRAEKTQSQTNTVYDPLCAGPRSIVEKTIGLIKRFRKLSGGHIRPKDSASFLQDLVVIAAFVANLQIERLAAESRTREDGQE